MTDEELMKSWEQVKHIGKVDHVSEDGMMALGSVFGELHKAIQDLRNELIERKIVENVYLILTIDNPQIVDFTFYTDEEVVQNRVLELNRMANEVVYWYITLVGNERNGS